MKNGDTPVSALTGDAYTNFAAHDDSNMTSYDPQCQGLTKREHFAGLAIQGLLSGGYSKNDFDGYQRLALRSCIIADALLKELEK